MRKAIFVYFFIITSILSVGALGRYENYKEMYEIERLLNERIIIINDFLYGEKNDKVLEELKDKLSKIELDAQLESDMSLLTHIYHNPSDYEYTSKVKIKEIKNIEITDNSIEMIANLEWTVFSNDFEDKLAKDKFVKDYNVKCTIKNNKLYLANIKFVE
jgi:hypothetical protein